jgi:hypothetical protein
MHGKNNKEKDIYNGSILIVNELKYDAKNELQCINCRYYRKETTINKDDDYHMVHYERKNNDGDNEIEDNKLDLAYAMTVHKAQGKGYDTVVIIVHSSMYGPLLTRNLLYTAITRAKQKCIIIGDERGLYECKKIMTPRITNLFKNTLRTRLFFDDMIIINRSISELVKMSAIQELLEGYQINALILGNNKSKKFKNELSKLHLAMIRNRTLLDMMLSFIKKKCISQKDNNNRSKTVEIIEV